MPPKPNPIFGNALPPPSNLGRYRLLSPSASVRVSPLCLGAMNFGDSWKDYMGACNKETVEEMLDFFYEQGGNFIDTANNYQSEESETWIGDWMEKRGVRDQMVIATKYTTHYRGGRNEIMANTTGNSTKSMVVSVNASLKKLKTDYIDLLYVHWWEYSTSIPELMQSLNQLVASGKVLYLGISDAPAWVAAKANEYARGHGLRPFSVYQGRWSAASRDFEREIIPMARDEGMALAPWGALGGGAFKTEAQRRVQQEQKQGRQTPATPEQIAVSRVLEKIAAEKKTLLTSVALAYVMQKTPYVFPIVGGRNVEQLRGNIEALALELTPEDIADIEAAVPFDLGFPHNFLTGGLPGNLSRPVKNYQNSGLLGLAAAYDYVPEQLAIRIPSIPKEE
ncbi:norsolorinic acid reductase [Ophiostoma piceae UAMH 11346]|uniref:Norsolorinic acid reductase n=1 Tax=Ophiostoma piceae (strain UAMH 11346) TaxID=1262450 RepID=S3C2B7_OPHP1|nr:norsolorinic acid reductase [Ophiostoma piceae UAMH 11346]